MQWDEHRKILVLTDSFHFLGYPSGGAFACAVGIQLSQVPFSLFLDVSGQMQELTPPGVEPRHRELS